MKVRTPFTHDGAAALVIGGVVVIAFPHYASGTVQIVLVTAAVMAALLALEVNVPSTGWMSPFKWMSPFGRTLPHKATRGGSHELRAMRSMLSGWRQPIPPGPPLPPDILRLLRPLIRGTLGLDSENDAHLEAARNVLSPLTWAVLTSDEREKPFWFQTLPPNKRQVADAVIRVLDELDFLDESVGDLDETMDPQQP